MRYHALPLLVAIVFLLVASHAWSAVVMVDADSDGLSDQEEVKLFTDPLVADSDEDGLLDGVEFHMGSNPLIADSDEDGLSDGDELARGTDILLSDSDEDWFNDGLEVREGTDPLDKSSVPPGTVRQVDEIAADQREVSAFRAE
ncbi:MAG: thrombospondin type 3 repeat-containing protein, partial [Nanoarchaeota archaeon]|nr:thrombospondin type 3 repeat-containing protein [Nanoarchaeota archaeon]